MAGALFGWGMLRLGDRQDPAPIIINTPAPTIMTMATATPGTIQVYVNGAVKIPDVYVLPYDSRVKQAIEAAGGFNEEANTAVVNLAEPLVDGTHIYVPDSEGSSETPSQVISDPEQPPPGGRNVGIGGLLVNINTAGAVELEELPGIGPAIAQKIIDYRTANGAFSSVEAVMDVSGIGEVKFKQIRDLITTGN